VTSSLNSWFERRARAFKGIVIFFAVVSHFGDWQFPYIKWMLKGSQYNEE
tara:strand:- start:405 stop:554 length:150 start_codon:yes stop_codon:yes gene_type:complete